MNRLASRPQSFDGAKPKLRLFDGYCGAGGAGMGYSRAGFVVTGADHNAQPHYPFAFERRDVLSYTPQELRERFDALHGSPPCQRYSEAAKFHGNSGDHPDLVEPTRALFKASGLPWVIENVVGAPIRADVMLCGTQFGLRIAKHRGFECSFPLGFRLLPPCDHSDVYDPWHGPGRTVEEFRAAQGTPWIPMAGGASRKRGVTGDVFNAIPPAFTEYLGAELLAHVTALQEAA